MNIPQVGGSTPPEVYTLAPEEDRNCPECGDEMKADARRCDHCGFDVVTGEKPSQAVPSLVGECPICGAALEEGEDCPSCEQAQRALDAQKRKRQKLNQANPESVEECPTCGGPLKEGQDCPCCTGEVLRETSPCPSCGFGMRAGALVCLDCGFRFEPPIQVKCQCGHHWKVDRSLAGKSVLCSACEGTVSVPARACTICGTPLEEDLDCPVCKQAQEKQAAEPKSNSVTCPRCGSDNYQKTSFASKAASFAVRHGAVGFLGRLLAPAIPSKTYHCKNCGAEW